MKRNGLLFAAVLAAGMGMFVPALAEETPSWPDTDLGGLLGSLLEDADLDSALQELGSSLEEADLDGVLQEIGSKLEEADLEGTLQALGSQLEDANSALRQGLDEVIEMATDENGNVDWEKVEASAQELIGLVTGTGIGTDFAADVSEEELDAAFEEIMAPYRKADEAMFAYIAERNADHLDAGDAQVFSKKVGYMGDVEQDEVKVLADFSQVNYTIEEDHMNMVSAATDTLLLTLAKDADGNFTVINEESAQDGEGYAASVEAMCAQVGITADEFYSSTQLGGINDAEALAEYLTEHPEIATAEYQGEQLTADELRQLSSDYMDQLFGDVFGDLEDMTEEMTE